jgi:hypothetical protein
MKPFSKSLTAILLVSALLAASMLAAPAAEKTEKAGLPTLLASCGQSPGPVKVEVFLKRLKLEYASIPRATANDLIERKKKGAPFKSLIIVTGASLKGMGGAGVSINDELERTRALIAEARKQGIKIIGAHVEGMARRSQGAMAGDNSDELSIDAVCPQASLLLIRQDGNEDGRFTAIAKSKNIPLLLFEKNMDLENVLKGLFTN